LKLIFLTFTTVLLNPITKMDSKYSITVLTNTLPGGYAPILAKYNANKPANWSTLCEANVCEGGFEVLLNEAEIRELRKYNDASLLDHNNYVRQLRWCRGKLCSYNGYEPLYDEEILLLGNALAAVLGADKVRITKQAG
jgi:hypothetical protein